MWLTARTVKVGLAPLKFLQEGRAPGPGEVTWISLGQWQWAPDLKRHGLRFSALIWIDHRVAQALSLRSGWTSRLATTPLLFSLPQSHMLRPNTPR